MKSHELRFDSRAGSSTLKTSCKSNVCSASFHSWLLQDLSVLQNLAGLFCTIASAHVLSVGRYNNGCQRELRFVAGGIFPLCVCQWVIFRFFAAPICKISIYSERYEAAHTSPRPFHYPNVVKAKGTAALLRKPTSLKCVQLGKKKEITSICAIQEQNYINNLSLSPLK